MKSGLRRAVLAIAFASVPGVVGVVGAQTPGVVYSSGTFKGYNNGEPFGITGGQYFAAANFTLTANATVTGIQVSAWGYPGPTVPTFPTFTWTAYTNDPAVAIPAYNNPSLSGVPGSVFASGTTTATASGYKLYTFAVPPTAFSAGQRYWLTLTANDNTVNGLTWDTSIDGPGDLGDVYRYNGVWYRLAVPNHADHGNGNSDHYGFNLFGTADVTTTPEPTSLALLGTGLVGLVPIARRRKRA